MPTYQVSEKKMGTKEITKPIEQEEWYRTLIEDCQAILTEGIWNYRLTLIKTYHLLGRRILEDKDNFTKGGYTIDGMSQHVAISLGKSQRTIECAIQFVKKFPNLDLLPEGKNISWHKIVQNYLPEPKENKIIIPVPKGKYGLIVIDPPWRYETEYDSEVRRVGSPYKELDISELEKIELPCADDCVLWLWATHKFLWDAKKLMDHWGFEYKLTLVWNKEKLGMGEWLRCQVEFCLLGIKGKPEWNLSNERDIITESRRQHSRKPDGFYKLVKKLTPTKGLDIFGRKKREGWDLWGDEPNKY